jgi:hypothetical protein
VWSPKSKTVGQRYSIPNRSFSAPIELLQKGFSKHQDLKSAHLVLPRLNDEADETWNKNALGRYQSLLHHPKSGFQRLRRMNVEYSHCGEPQWQEHSINIQIAERALSEVHYDRKDRKIYDAFHNIAACQGNLWVLDAHQLFLAREFGIIDLPCLTQEELDDKSKSDAITKLITLTQVLWLVVQLIVRKSKNLPSSQLEIMTLAFAACSGINYAILWDKPQGINVPIYIKAKRFATPKELARLAEGGPAWLIPGRRVSVWIPNTSIHMNCETTFTSAYISMAFGSFVFGGLHILAWNFLFPTSIEKMLWRVGSILTFGIPILTGMLNVLVHILVQKVRKGRFSRVVAISMGILSSIIMVPYFLIRLFMTVEVFRTLFFLEPGAYISTWVSNVPSFA